MSRRSKPQTIAAAEDPEEFMALLLHAQTNSCSCIFGEYFRRLGENVKKKYIKEPK